MWFLVYKLLNQFKIYFPLGQTVANIIFTAQKLIFEKYNPQSFTPDQLFRLTK